MRRIVLLCATRRGYLFLEKLADLAPDAELVVFSFREDPWEPPYFEDILALAKQRGARFYETKNIGAEKWQSFWENESVDLMLVVSWRFMIPANVYRKPRRGTFVFHDSLLPAYRGFGPTVWAMINGEDHTGVTLFEIVDEVDAGNIIDQQRVPIGFEETITIVLPRVTDTYLELLERNLDLLLDGTAPRRPQDLRLATYTCKRLPEDNRIDWSADSIEVYNLIRAVTHPYPGAFTSLDGRKLAIWAAQHQEIPTYAGRIPGRVIQVRPGEGAVVMTGNGALLVTEVQLEGRERVRADQVLNSLSQTLGR